MSEQEYIEELISKYFSGEASPEEAMHLEDWKNKSEANRLHFAQCERMFAFPKHEADVKKGWSKVSAQLSGSEKIIPIRSFSYWRVAASVALLLGVGALMYWLNKNGNEGIEYVTHTEPKQVSLSDGSDVRISPNSSLTAEDGFGKKERMLHLKGSAYFTVVHDEKIPFVVDAGGVFIKDIGTKFFIRTSADTDTVHVHVDEGVVLLFDDKGADIEIKAGGNALYIKSKKQIVSNATQTAQSAALSFSNTTLAEVLKKLSATYSTSIEIANPVLGNCPITTQFNNNEKLETILSVIAETLGLRYEKTEKGYIFKGEACQP